MVSAKELLSRLKADGWNLDEEGVESLLEDRNLNIQQANQEVLNSDLKDVGATCLHDDLLKGKKNSLPGPLVLQVSKMRNVSAPKAFEESGGAPRMLRVTLTDGFGTVQGLEVQNIKTLSLKTAPGTKVRLSGKIPISGGFLLLTPNNITVIGGTVQELYDKWKLSASVSKYSRGVCAADGSGPPSWVPFGKRIVKNQTEMQKFKALKDPEGKEKVDGEFENQRKQVVKELSKEGNLKVFGGGKQMLDANVQKVVNAGFSLDVAEWALRNSKNDPVKAIKELRAAASGQPPPERNNYWEDDEERNTGGRRGRGGRGRGRGRGRGGGGPDDSDDDFEPPPNMPRPSGPASLFDFFDTKMIEKKGNVNFVEPVADVRGPAYNPPGRGSDRRGRGGGYQRGRGGRGGYSNRGAINGSVTPPSMTAENWPAPGEERAPPPSNRSYLESKELMEEKEREDNSLRKPPVRMGQGGSRDYHLNNTQDRGQGYGRVDGRQRGGYYARDSDYREGGGARQEDSGRGRDNYFHDRGGHRGRGGGNYRGGSRGNNYGGGGGYAGGDSGGSGYYSEEYRGGRGNSANASRGGGNYGVGYKDGNYNRSMENRGGGNYRSDGNSYSDSRGGNKTSGGGGGTNTHYGGRYDQYSNRQGSYGGNYDSSYGGGRDNWSSGRGGRSAEYSAKELEMIQDFQHSMTVSGHYQPDYDNRGTSHVRYEGGSDYSNFVGTLEFHRGGRGGGRRGRGNYY
ncbi:tudor domain-containing protein 3-like isoform X1 [Eriocheir sinensis]|uniref:tudor domain-containing protein 3-like isoform X1 n=1 Tax=Eriocheir sinensis TaxID=95602 RepID=UPI0021C7908A|nr:tudor domain-containing protein 3-like isoform X1 [Eriocheir sinensis]